MSELEITLDTKMKDIANVYPRVPFRLSDIDICCKTSIPVNSNPKMKLIIIRYALTNISWAKKCEETIAEIATRHEQSPQYILDFIIKSTEIKAEDKLSRFQINELETEFTDAIDRCKYLLDTEWSDERCRFDHGTDDYYSNQRKAERILTKLMNAGLEIEPYLRAFLAIC